MDPATIIGLLLALGAVFGALFMGGLNPIGIFLADIPSIILVFGGTIGVTMASGTMPAAINAIKVLIKAFTGGAVEDPGDNVRLLVEFADVARREGLLALEPRLEEIDDPFFRKGMEMAVDGTDPEALREQLEIDLDKTRERHTQGAKFFVTAAGYAPAMGMIGTVIGLVDMLGNLDDPSSLGPSMAVAFLTTLWGAFLANFLFSPIANKLKKMSSDELAAREIVLEGILAVQAGSNPRAIAGMLGSFLPPAAREGLSEDQKSA
ncbi:MAG: chemotaxis protein MotA [Acidimicrobiales bacterium]|jgi:chemotaxis protein MotA